MSPACHTDLCRQGRSPCPTPSACTRVVRLHGRLQECRPANDDITQELPQLGWMVPVTVLLAVASSIVWPWGFAA